MDAADIFHRVAHHPPSGPRVVEAHQRVRNATANFMEVLNALLPEGREKALAMTKAEEAMFWANAAVARNQ